jgi:hypothetical protein
MVPNGFVDREFIHNFAFVVGNSSLQEVHHFKVSVTSPGEVQVKDGRIVPADLLSEDPYHYKDSKDETEKVFTDKELDNQSSVKL